MYEYDKELLKTWHAQKRRWNGKVITTSRQWNNNAEGAATVSTYNMGNVWSAVRDYYQSREWE